MWRDEGAAQPEPAGPIDTSKLQRIEVVNKYPPGEIARAGLTLVALGCGLLLLWRIQDVVFLMLLAILLATAIEPLVNRLRRGPFSRGAGVLAVYTAIMALIAIPIYLVAPSTMDQLSAFTTQLPQRLEDLQTSASQIGLTELRGIAVGAVSTARAALERPAQPQGAEIVAVGATALQVAVSAVAIFVLAFYWLVERASIKRVVLRSVTARHARDVNTVWLEVEEKLGGWVRGQLLLMLIIGVAAGIGFFVLGLPSQVLLAVAAGLFEIVPMLGPILAFAPGVLVALTVSPQTALAVLIYAVIVQQIASNVLVPRVMRETVGISPLTVLLGILIGATLYGIPGAFLAVPVAGALQVVLAHLLRVEDPQQTEEHLGGKTAPAKVEETAARPPTVA